MMQTFLVILAVFAVIDLLFCGVVLLLAWNEYRRVCRTAREEGRMMPPPATLDFLLLAMMGICGIALFYGAIWFLLRR